MFAQANLQCVEAISAGTIRLQKVAMAEGGTLEQLVAAVAAEAEEQQASLTGPCKCVIGVDTDICPSAKI